MVRLQLLRDGAAREDAEVPVGGHSESVERTPGEPHPAEPWNSGGTRETMGLMMCLWLVRVLFLDVRIAQKDCANLIQSISWRVQLFVSYSILV